MTTNCCQQSYILAKNKSDETRGPKCRWLLFVGWVLWTLATGGNCGAMTQVSQLWHNHNCRKSAYTSEAVDSDDVLPLLLLVWNGVNKLPLESVQISLNRSLSVRQRTSRLESLDTRVQSQEHNKHYWLAGKKANTNAHRQRRRHDALLAGKCYKIINLLDDAIQATWIKLASIDLINHQWHKKY